MLPEISLNVLDLVQNSIHAKADFIQIQIKKDNRSKTLYVCIEDNGCGMNDEQLSRVIDPFYTTRTTRKVGLGIPFFRAEALQTGGEFHIWSKPDVGTRIQATFMQSNIDCMPLGDINNTILLLITMNETIDFLYTYCNLDKTFSLDTRELRNILGDIPFSTPDVKNFINSYLIEHQIDVDSM